MSNAPHDYCKLWLRQNDAVEREADQKAFDALPASLRQVVDEAPIQIACTVLLQGSRKFGAAAMEAALREDLDRWLASFAAPAA